MADLAEARCVCSHPLKVRPEGRNAGYREEKHESPLVLGGTQLRWITGFRS